MRDDGSFSVSELTDVSVFISIQYQIMRPITVAAR
jgi:hypothetical protein